MVNDMRYRIAISVLCLAALLAPAPARAQSAYGWDAATNEALYQEALSYIKTFQTDLVGEQAYYMSQDLVSEMVGAYRSNPYAWMGQIHTFCDKLEAMYPPTLSHPAVSRKAADHYDRIRRGITRLRDYPMHEVSLNGDRVAMASGQSDAFHAANKQSLQLRRARLFQFLRGPRPVGNELQVAKLVAIVSLFRQWHWQQRLLVQRATSSRYIPTRRSQRAMAPICFI